MVLRHMTIPQADRRDSSFDPTAVLGSLPVPVVVIDADGWIRFVNFRAQELFDSGASSLIGQPLDVLMPLDNPIVQLIDQAVRRNTMMVDYAAVLDTPRTGRRRVTATVGPFGDPPGAAILALQETSVARDIDKQLSHRGAARSVSALAAMMAHEVKNPLSGIRGAAQLLELNADEGDRELTRLICDEADRIVALVDRIEAFAADRPADKGPVNIHSVLEHVRKIAQNGFARHIRFTERYDPSLPSVFGNRDQLVQVFLNLVKNAAEAAADEAGEIVLATSYQRGVTFTRAGGGSRVHLPLRISVQDNGRGIPEDLEDHLFEPFVTTRPDGSGLGLALVAKIVDDHGGTIAFESQPRRTVFRVNLPMYGEPGIVP